MPGALAWFDSAAGTITLLLAGVLALLVGMCDAALVDLREELVLYSYSVRGVEYIASQDVSQLSAYLPSEKPITSVVAVRYDPANPANSIVISERWSGLR
ncbi:MAG: hypothetical protein ABSH45_20740 [Bryobacteraceae bacterium]